MSIFKNVFNTLPANTKIDFKKVSEVRRIKMGREGYDINTINWDHYTKVLEAKYIKLKES
jgi:hypothetical protein